MEFKNFFKFPGGHNEVISTPERITAKSAIDNAVNRINSSELTEEQIKKILGNLSESN